MSREITVDPKVFALAEYFLADTSFDHDAAMSLARRIQEAVEDWFSDRE